MWPAASGSQGKLNVEALRPIGGLALRLMFGEGWKWLSAVGMLLLLGAAFSALGLANSVARERRFARKGTTAKAIVRKTDEGARTCRVDYSFTTDGGKRHRGQGSLPSERGKGLTRGSELEIEYVADNPALSRPTGTGQGNALWLLAAFPIALIIAATRSGGMRREGPGSSPTGCAPRARWWRRRHPSASSAPTADASATASACPTGTAPSARTW